MNVERKNLSKNPAFYQEGWKIEATTQELESLKSTIERLLDSQTVYCFNCNMGSDVIEITQTDEKPKTQWQPPILP